MSATTDNGQGLRDVLAHWTRLSKQGETVPGEYVRGHTAGLDLCIEQLTEALATHPPQQEREADRPTYVFLQPGDYICATDESPQGMRDEFAPVGEGPFTGLPWCDGLKPMRRLASMHFAAAPAAPATPDSADAPYWAGYRAGMAMVLTNYANKPALDMDHFCRGESGAGEWCYRSEVPSVCGYCGEPNAAQIRASGQTAIDMEIRRMRAEAATPEPACGWRHVANEWADMAINGIQWMRNQRDGIAGSIDDGLAEMLANHDRIQALQATIAATPESAEPVAWLHTVVQDDGEGDQALSFAPDNFPLQGVGGFRSLRHVPLYTHPTPAASDGGLREALEKARDLFESIINDDDGVDVALNSCLGFDICQDALIATPPTEQAKPSEATLLNDASLESQLRKACGRWETIPKWLRDLTRDEPVAAPAQVTDAEAVFPKSVIASLMSTRDRMKNYLTLAYGDQFDGDLDNMQEAIAALQRARRALALRGAPPPAAAGVVELQAEIDRLTAVINTPQADDFLRAVSIEAEHQRQRWGSEHDAGKTPADWFWLVGYLAGKSLHAHAGGNVEKAEHHVITTAAALANWHRAMHGQTDMRPGIDGESALAGQQKEGGR